MPLVMLTAEQVQKLMGQDGPVELCAPDGLRMGFYTPAPAKQYKLDPGIDDEEIRRRMTDRIGRPLADILRDLERRA